MTVTDGRTQRRQRTHDALVAVGVALLEEGRSSATIEEITGRAGVGFGSFTNHFASREAFFGEAMLAVLDRYAGMLEAATAGIERPDERFATSFRLVGRLARSQPALLAPFDTAGMDILFSDRGLRTLALEDLRAGVDQGCFAPGDPEVLMLAVGGTLLALIRHLRDDAEVDAAQVTDDLVERLLLLLGVERASASRLAHAPL